MVEVYRGLCQGQGGVLGAIRVGPGTPEKDQGNGIKRR